MRQSAFQPACRRLLFRLRVACTPATYQEILFTPSYSSPKGKLQNYPWFAQLDSSKLPQIEALEETEVKFFKIQTESLSEHNDGVELPLNIRPVIVTFGKALRCTVMRYTRALTPAGLLMLSKLRITILLCYYQQIDLVSFLLLKSVLEKNF